MLRKDVDARDKPGHDEKAIAEDEVFRSSW
jgi:hypothetical protein